MINEKVSAGSMMAYGYVKGFDGDKNGGMLRMWEECSVLVLFLKNVSIKCFKEESDYWRHFQKREALDVEDGGPETKVVFAPDM